MAKAKPKERDGFIGRRVQGADVNFRDKRVYFARPGAWISKHGEFLLGGCLGLVLAGLWVIAAITIVIVNLVTDGIDDEAVTWLLFRGPAIAGCLLLLAMPMFARRSRHENRLGRQLANGDAVEAPISNRAKRLAEIARGRRPGYFEQAQLLAKASAMRAQARQLEQLAAATDQQITGEDFGPRATELATRLRATAEQHDELVDAWMADGGRDA